MGKAPNFYSSLKVHETSLGDLLGDHSNFQQVPEDWYVLVADIIDSTTAVNNGHHNEVNLVATGCVIAVLNLAENECGSVPFFFGGDGATFLIPPQIKDRALSVLEKHNRNSRKNFGFELSIGFYQVAKLYQDNIELKIAKAKVSSTLVIPVILGQGLQIAENIIKSKPDNSSILIDDTPLNLQGMECKWDKVDPPKQENEVLSLIISGCGNTDFSKVYSQIMDQIDSIYGLAGERKPISVNKLKIKLSCQRINNEMKTKIGKWALPVFLKNFMINSVGPLYLRNSKVGRNYLSQLVELSDNLTLDGRINTVITGNKAQRETLFIFLDELEQKGLIKYGFHISRESIMSCYVKDLKTNDHIHFVDGGDGGYTKAANVLKEKFEIFRKEQQKGSVGN